MVVPLLWLSVALFGGGCARMRAALEPWVHLDILCVAVWATSIYITDLSDYLQPSSHSWGAMLSASVATPPAPHSTATNGLGGPATQALLEITMPWSGGLVLLTAVAAAFNGLAYVARRREERAGQPTECHRSGLEKDDNVMISVDVGHEDAVMPGRLSVQAPPDVPPRTPGRSS